MTNDVFRFIAGGIGATILITVASFATGALLGIPLAVARRSHRRSLRWIGGIYTDLVRAVPPVVWLFLVFFGLPQIGIELAAIEAAIVTFGLVAASYLGEIYRSGLSAIGRGQSEAAAALGMSSFDTGRLVLAPQVLRVIVPTTATYATGLLKDSALASTIGVLELVFRTNDQIQLVGNGLTLYMFTGAIYLLLSLPLGIIARLVDGRLRDRFSLS